MSHETPIKQRLRITFGKSGPLKYTGHLDVARLWERVLRRAELPILYTQGFNARPRIQLASPLPLGITSTCEIVDVMLHTPLPPHETEEHMGESMHQPAEHTPFAYLQSRLQSVSPEGLCIFHIIEVPVRSPALQALVRSAEYRITLVDPIDRGDIQVRIDDILAAEEIIKQKAGKKGKIKTVNLRPLIHSLALDDDGSISAHLATGDQGNLRPDDLLAEMGLSDTYHQIHRLRLHWEKNS